MMPTNEIQMTIECQCMSMLNAGGLLVVRLVVLDSSCSSKEDTTSTSNHAVSLDDDGFFIQHKKDFNLLLIVFCSEGGLDNMCCTTRDCSCNRRGMKGLFERNLKLRFTGIWKLFIAPHCFTVISTTTFSSTKSHNDRRPTTNKFKVSYR